LDIIKNPQPIKVTLVWTDYPATPSAAKVLINDLDLEVIDTQASITYIGNEALTGKKEADHINNIEQIVIPHPRTPRKINIRVIGYNIPQGPQRFSLTVSGHISTELLVAEEEMDVNRTGVYITLLLCGLFLVAVTISACVYFRRKFGIPICEDMPKFNLFGKRRLPVVRRVARQVTDDDADDADEKHVFLPTQPVVQAREIVFDDT